MVKRVLTAVFMLIMLLPVYVYAQSTDSLSVYFDIGSRQVDTSLSGNVGKLDSVAGVILRYSSNPGFHISMTGYASPDGAPGFNDWLSARRTEEVLRWLEDRLGSRFSSAWVDTSSAGVDWDGLERLISSGLTFKGSDEVLSIVRDMPLYVIEDGRITGGRKKSLMDLHRGDVFRYMMDNVFPELRRVGITVRYTRSVPVTLVPSMKAPAEQLDIAGPVYGRPLAGTLQPPEPEPFYRLALKTNLLADAVLMPSLEAEYLIDEHWSVAAHGAVAWWSKDAAHKFYQIATVYPEARWWFRTREAWHGHYLGLFAGGTWYDLENGGRGYQGEGGFVGVSYGYMFPIAERLSLEAGIGLGYLYTKYREYLPVPYMGGTHYVYQQTSQMNYFGPLKVKLALVWRLWDTNRKGGGR